MPEPILSGSILSVGEESYYFQIHFDAVEQHFGPVGAFEVRQVEIITSCDFEIDRNRRRMQSYMKRAMDKYVDGFGPMLDAIPLIHPQIITTRAVT